MNKNQNIRFNMDKESDIMAWESLHSKDVGERFKSQNRFVIEAINYYYERVMRIQEDPYLETREKEDAFADRIVGKVERKVLSNLPTLLGLYVKKDYEREGFHLQRLYKRRVADDKGIMRSTFGDIMSTSPNYK